jgi:NDP-sugar pyrophosphorylase family protein
VVAKGRCNRGQIQQVLRYGDAHRVRVSYSRARHDAANTGSGEATLRNLERWDLRGAALVFPTDSLFDFDLAAMLAQHRESGAIVTMASVRRDATEVAGRYGVLVADRRGYGRRFVEKPSLAQALSLAGAGGELYTNAGMYLIDCDRLRGLLTGGALSGLVERQLDWGTDLLPWLVAQGYPVKHHPISRFGDLGSPRGYLDTLREVLAGAYALPRPPRIHPSSLARRNPCTGRTLAEMIRSGAVRLGSNVRIGAEVEIGPGAELSDVDIGDEVDVGEGCVLSGVACQDGTIIGPYAWLRDTWLGSMTTLESTAAAPVVTDDYTAIGDEVSVGAGTRLTAVTVHPGLTIPAFSTIRPGTEVTDSLNSAISH